jgi:protein-tyrosine-phosphatase
LLRLDGMIRNRTQQGSMQFSTIRELAKLCIDSGPCNRSALWSFRDPAPAWSEFVDAIKPLVRYQFGRIARLLLPRGIIERAHIARTLNNPARRIYLIQQTKRALRIRRHRTSTLQAPVRSVLFVCHGNIIRSPMAAALLKVRLATYSGTSLDVSSAGTSARDGKSADQRAVSAAKEFGVDLVGHQACRLTHDLLRQADLVIAMDFVNEARIIALSPESRPKILMLGAFADLEHFSSVEVPDPYDGDSMDVQRCFVVLDVCVSRLAEKLSAISVR